MVDSPLVLPYTILMTVLSQERPSLPKLQRYVAEMLFIVIGGKDGKEKLERCIYRENLMVGGRGMVGS